MRVDWTEQQVKDLQKKLNVWPSGNLEHQTYAALTKALGMVPVPPVEKPEPDLNPYFVQDHRLYKDNLPVVYEQTEMHGGVMGPGRPYLIVVHYTGTSGLDSPLDWLTRRGNRAANQVVSAHLIIDRDGTVYQLLPFNQIAWHAGASSYDGVSGCNAFSIGIENVGTGADWPEAQVEANRLVIEALCDAYDIEDVVGHSDVAPGRKPDPGTRYPWDKIVSEAVE